MALKIFGAGMAGLLAAHVLRRHDPVIYEAQPSLPNNHKALLRFRSAAVSEATGIAFKRVKVLKGIWDYRTNQLLDRAPLDLSNLYSLKVIGTIHGRSVVNLEPSERYIAPEDFIARLAKGLNIQYNASLTGAIAKTEDSKISTVPMPLLMDMLSIDHKHQFVSKKIWTITTEILYPSVDVYQTIYFPDPGDSLYRVSITGKRLTFEYMSDPIAVKKNNLAEAMKHIFGLSGLQLTEQWDISSQRYGKILPIDDDARRSFILMATDLYHIYSIGRFAVWRQILLDDVVKDCQFVDTLLKQRDRYASKFLTAHR